MKMNWNYIAGFFDGEGCLAHHKYIDTKGVHRGTYKIIISQKEIKVLKEIQKFLEKNNIETFWLKRNDLRWTGGRIIHNLGISKFLSVRRFLENILDKTIVKKQQIKEALNDNNYTKKWTQLSNFEIKQAKTLYEYDFKIYQIAKIIKRSDEALYRLRDKRKLGIQGICL